MKIKDRFRSQLLITSAISTGPLFFTGGGGGGGHQGFGSWAGFGGGAGGILFRLPTDPTGLALHGTSPHGSKRSGTGIGSVLSYPTLLDFFGGGP